MIWDFVYEGDIMGKPRMTKADKWKKRPVTSRYWAMKDMLVLAAKKQSFVLDAQFIISIQIEMPKSWSKKKKEEMLGSPHQQTPDLDNILKGIQDSLLQEDSHIWKVYAMKYWSDKNKICIKNLEE